MLKYEEIKSIALGLGAVQCGIASAERLDLAPRGFHPRDVHCKCKLCLDACPVEALDGGMANQKLYRENSTLEHARGWDIYTPIAVVKPLVIYTSPILHLD